MFVDRAADDPSPPAATAPLAAKTPGQRFLILDALRGICACMVVLFHFATTSPVAASALVRESWLFVDFFFVLSGFVIVSNYHAKLHDGLPVRTFLLLRLARIYPLHLVILAAFVAMECAGAALAGNGLMHRAAFDSAHAPTAIATNLAFLQIFGIENRGTWNIPAWSIAAEFWTYVLFAVTARPSFRRPLLWFGVTAGAAAIVLLGVEGNANATFAWALPRCLLGFSVGALAWLAWGRIEAAANGRRRGWTLVELAVVAAALAFVTAVGSSPWTLAAPLVFAAVVLVFARGGGAISRVLGLRLPLFLGSISYSIYMVHSFVQARFEDLLRIVESGGGGALTSDMILPDGRHISLSGTTPLQGTWLTMAMLVTVIAAAAVSWRLIERPMQRWGRAHARRWPDAAAPVRIGARQKILA